MEGFLLIFVLVFVFIGLPMMIIRQNDYAKYVEECEKSNRFPMDYNSWKKATRRGGLF